MGLLNRRKRAEHHDEFEEKLASQIRATQELAALLKRLERETEVFRLRTQRAKGN